MKLFGRLKPQQSANRIADVEAPPNPVDAQRGDDAFTWQANGSLQLRHVDAGSCNGCELEIASIFSPHYDVEQFGVRLVASPRHADGLLVTGPVTRNMAAPLRKTFAALPRPAVVIALGDCARDCGVFAGAYGLEGGVGDVLDVDVMIPGCPPSPEVIVEALRKLTGT
ncbi:MAG: NADH-quinone oxidoreductase subunit B family protein [Minisyncoccia bacterium]